MLSLLRQDTLHGLTHYIISGAGTSFISEKFEQFFRKLNIEQAISLSYTHQSSSQAEACIEFLKKTIEKGFETNTEINLVSSI